MIVFIDRVPASEIPNRIWFQKGMFNLRLTGINSPDPQKPDFEPVYLPMLSWKKIGRLILLDLSWRHPGAVVFLMPSWPFIHIQRLMAYHLDTQEELE